MSSRLPLLSSAQQADKPLHADEARKQCHAEKIKLEKLRGRLEEVMRKRATALTVAEVSKLAQEQSTLEIEIEVAERCVADRDAQLEELLDEQWLARMTAERAILERENGPEANALYAECDDLFAKLKINLSKQWKLYLKTIAFHKAVDGRLEPLSLAEHRIRLCDPRIPDYRRFLPPLWEVFRRLPPVYSNDSGRQLDVFDPDYEPPPRPPTVSANPPAATPQGSSLVRSVHRPELPPQVDPAEQQPSEEQSLSLVREVHRVQLAREDERDRAVQADINKR